MHFCLVRSGLGFKEGHMACPTMPALNYGIEFQYACTVHTCRAMQASFNGYLHEVLADGSCMTQTFVASPPKLKYVVQS